MKILNHNNCGMYNGIAISKVFITFMRFVLKLGLVMTVVSMFSSFCLINVYGDIHNDGEPANTILNGSFEEGLYSPTEIPIEWTWDAWQPSAIHTWDDIHVQTGGKSVKISAPIPNDARWIQTVDVEPNKTYFLSGWIKTDNVQHVDGPQVAGANLSLYGDWRRSKGVFGTQDWTRRGFLFNSAGDHQLTIAARLGAWGGTTIGTAWFDDLQLKQIVPLDPHPSWKILVLIYRETDFEVTDDKGTYHHYVASISQTEMEQAALAARQFVEIDIPALTSGNMVPEITVRFPERALNELTPNGGGWWPSPADTMAERSPEFDSVIVVWDPRVFDLANNNYEWIGSADGLASYSGTGQTYLAMQVDAAVYRGHRNVFKHEWGHSILYYFDAMGTAPKPTVSNHTDATDYVNCITGQFYVWQDETLADPIPNSIYNNESGFTHDYYSGMTATVDEPSHCLGITPEAWALGGPVSHSGNIIEETLNEYMGFEPIQSTISFTSETSGCLLGAVGKYSFDAALTNVSEKTFTNISVEIDELTNDNFLLTNNGLIGEGERFEVPNSDDYTDGMLSPGEYVDVPFTVCLKNRDPFSFFVDVYGKVDM